MDDVFSALSVLQNRIKNRKTAATSKNPSSSRTHLLICVRTFEVVAGKVVDIGMLTFLDMAGQYRMRSSKHPPENEDKPIIFENPPPENETKFINQSAF